MYALKLEREGYSAATVEKVISDLKSLGYINDKLFAQKYIYDRAKLNPKSKRMIRFELGSRGIPEDVADEALSEWKTDDSVTAVVLVRKKFGKHSPTDEKSLKGYAPFSTTEASARRQPKLPLKSSGKAPFDTGTSFHQPRSQDCKKKRGGLSPLALYNLLQTLLSKPGFKLLDKCRQYLKHITYNTQGSTLNIGASGFLFMATMVSDDDMPARCWIAPEIPQAIYTFGPTVFRFDPPDGYSLSSLRRPSLVKRLLLHRAPVQVLPQAQNFGIAQASAAGYDDIGFGKLTISQSVLTTSSTLIRTSSAILTSGLMISPVLDESGSNAFITLGRTVDIWGLRSGHIMVAIRFPPKAGLV
jgi:hypothetical protein